MDVQRVGYAKRKRIRQVTYLILVAAGLAAVTWGFSRLEPAAPVVERASVWMGEVERGPMIIEVRGTGTLVPEEIRWIAAATNGRVELIPVLPGSAVTINTILAELDDPALEREALDAALQVKKAVAELDNLEVDIENQDLTQQAEAASIQADYLQSRLEADRYEALAREGLVSDLNLKVLQITADELQERHHLEQKRLEMGPRSRRNSKRPRSCSISASLAVILA